MKHTIENRFTASYDMIAEFGRKYAVGPRPWTYWFIPVLLGVWIAFGDEPMVSSLAPSLLFMQLFMPDLYAAISLWGGKKNSGGEYPQTRVIFGEDIQIFEGPVHLTFPYERIQKAVCLKHSYVLLLGKRNGILLDPQGFVEGSWEELKELLREKQPEVKLPE